MTVAESKPKRFLPDAPQPKKLPGTRPVECLGQTFASEDERRHHDLARLRELSPELRKHHSPAFANVCCLTRSRPATRRPPQPSVRLATIAIRAPSGLTARREMPSRPRSSKSAISRQSEPSDHANNREPSPIRISPSGVHA